MGDKQQMRKGAFNHDPAAQFTARKLRSEKSASERVLWSYLRKERTGYSFRTQVRVANFYLDFYCAKAKLCIEVDGPVHPEQVEHDRRRTEWLNGQGIRVIRFAVEDVAVRSAWVVAAIAQAAAPSTA